MTFNQIQEKMNVAFEAIGKLSVELTKSKDNLRNLQDEERKYTEGLADSKDAYGLVKRQDVVVLGTFKNANNNLEDVTKILEQVKLKGLIAKAQVDILERDLQVYKEQYSKLEDLMQNHDNTLRFVNEKKDGIN
jgi:chromosome segregation ATPase